jgi:acetoin utilization deacetylase AcuC-like enzyme
MRTGFYWDEKCFWHGGGNYAFTLPVGGNVQPTMGGLPENPETKRRLKNLMDVTGLLSEVHAQSAPNATLEDLIRVHPATYLNQFKQMSDNGGGELGLRTPFSSGGYETATLSTGLTIKAIADVLAGVYDNAYALSRPPGHHCLPDFPNGFCLLNNIAVGTEAALANGSAERVAIVDWDVHHGNGTEAIFYDRNDVLTISIHQEKNYPTDTGDLSDRGSGTGEGYNLNIPLPPGCGHAAYLETLERIVIPALTDFAPDIIIVACGFDASALDPLAHMLCTAQTFAMMTELMLETAADLCDGKLVLVHEGGYSEVYVPFCGHAVIAQLAASSIDAPDPLGNLMIARQPNLRMQAFHSTLIGEMAASFGYD